MQWERGGWGGVGFEVAKGIGDDVSAYLLGTTKRKKRIVTCQQGRQKISNTEGQ